MPQATYRSTVVLMSCTTLLVGKLASYNGSTIIARNDDSGSGRYDPKRFIAVKPEDQPRHYTSVLSHVAIKLPDNPCNYSIFPNVLPNRGVLAEAGANEYNVAMSATETIAVNERVLAADPMVEYVPAHGTPDDADYQPETLGSIGEEDIITLVLPYVRTAREGVLRFGQLLEQYGTYEANGVIFSDPDNIWYVETIGGHHWIARRVPDNAYATIPNQLGIDRFDLNDAFGERHEYMCSADLPEFMLTNNLDMTMPAATPTVGYQASAISSDITRIGNHGIFNPRHAFGTATHKDHIYNTPRAWYMQRYFNPSLDWDSEQAIYTPTSDDIPWCAIPERKIGIEDVDCVLSSHFEGTPYDPYGNLGTPESRHRYRTIGINRTGHMVAIEQRGDKPAAFATVYWASFGSGPFTAVAPLYANVTDTPAYLRDTAPTASTDSLYWTNRIIAALADSHFNETSNAIEQYIEEVHSFGYRHVAATDADLEQRFGQEVFAQEAAIQEQQQAQLHQALEAANEQMAQYLQQRTAKLLDSVLYTVSNLMHNSFVLSDRWA